MIRSNRLLSGALAAVACLLFLPAAARAQHPDITGKWTIVRERCMPPQKVGNVEAVQSLSYEMTISMDADTVVIKRKNEMRGGARNKSEDRFVIDGNPWSQETESGEMTITAEWKDNVLMLTRTTTMEMRGRPMSTSMVEMWQVVEQGDDVGMAISIERGGPPSAGAPGAPGGGGRTGGPPGGRSMRGGGRGGGGGVTSNPILIYILKKR